MSVAALEWAHSALARSRVGLGSPVARFLLTLAEHADAAGVCLASVDRLLLRSGLSLAEARFGWMCLADAGLAAAGPEVLDGPSALPLTFVLAIEPRRLGAALAGVAQVVPLRR